MQFLWDRVNTTQMLLQEGYEVEDMVYKNEEINITREFQSRRESLRYLQKLPLEHKIILSKQLISNCIETFGEQQVYLSFSGGKDSTVLSSLACSLKPNILHLFSDTGCEYPETLSFVEEERQRGKNIVSVYPICRDGSIWTFERIVATYGYPLFSKAIANGIRTYRHAKTPITKQHALDYIERMYPQALPYLDYNISDLCCDKLKKSPLKRMARHMQMQCSIIGTLAEESQIRTRDWLTYGSNIFFQKKDNQCRPLSFWTNQDIWNYIKLFKLPVSALYNQGYQRNGCMYCGFGLRSEKRKFGINRFERLAQTHPKQYEYMVSRWASLFKECGIPY